MEHVEAYHSLSKLAWVHPEHKQRKCTFNEWMKKYQTFLQTGYAMCTCTCARLMHVYARRSLFHRILLDCRLTTDLHSQDPYLAAQEVLPRRLLGRGSKCVACQC